MNSKEEKVVKDFLLEFENIKESQLSISWIIPSLILSRKLFKNQSHTKKFTNEVLLMDFRDYVYKSRPLLLGKINKEIISLESDKALTILNNIVKFIYSLDDSNNSQPNNKKNMDSFFSEWSQFLKSQSNPPSK